MMSLEEFKQKTKENPEGLMFDIICKKCQSNKVGMEFNDEVLDFHEGCDTCGYGSGADIRSELLIKCRECGNAFHKIQERFER